MKSEADLIVKYGIIPGSTFVAKPAQGLEARPTDEEHPANELGDAQFLKLLGKGEGPYQFAAIACENTGKPMFMRTGDLQWYTPASQSGSKHPQAGCKARVSAEAAE